MLDWNVDDGGMEWNVDDGWNRNEATLSIDDINTISSE